ncbi:PilZ domain-containing protein [Megalodesulfovibrio paquesii]
MHVFRADASNHVALVCPACHSRRLLDGAKLGSVKQPATMRCTCGNVFRCRFELQPAQPVPPSSPAPAVPSSTVADELPVFSADRHNRFTIICPACSDARTLDGEKLRHIKQPATMKCRCGKIFKCRLKFFEPEFPPEDPEAIKPHEAIDLPDFQNVEGTQNFSKMAQEAALANRKALMTFRGDMFSTVEQLLDSATEHTLNEEETEALLRGAPHEEGEEELPLPPEATMNIGFPARELPGELADEELHDADDTAPPDGAGNVGGSQDELDDTFDEAAQARAMAVLRQASLEKKRAREAMEHAAPQGVPGAAQRVPESPLPSSRQQHEANLDAQLQAVAREREALAALRRELEQEREHMLQQKAKLEALLRRAAALPQSPTGPAQLEPAVSLFRADAAGVIQVECPSCGAGKVLKAADVATVRQPARMKCKGCGTVFPCRFELQPPTAEQLDIPTFYADLAGNVTLVCPSCHAGNTVDGEQLRGLKQPASIRCNSCDTEFPCRVVLGEPRGARAGDPPGELWRQPRGTTPLPASTTLASPSPMPAASPKAPTAPLVASPLARPEPAPPAAETPEEAPAPEQSPLSSDRIAEPWRATGQPADAAGQEELEEDPDELSLTMDAAALSRLLAPYATRLEGLPETNEEADEDESELFRTMAPDRLQELFAEEDPSMEPIPLVGVQPDSVIAGQAETLLPAFNGEFAAEDADSPSLDPTLLAEVVPAVPFETVHGPVPPDTPTYYVDEKRQVMVLCPKCERGRNLDFYGHPEVGPVIRTWCKCGNEYMCRLEFRRNYRKRVNLSGTFYVPANGLRGEMTVQDISLGGVGFVTTSNYFLKPETIVELNFQLDDLKMTPIHRRVRVRSVKETLIGAEFLEHRERDKDLGYYLMP